MKRLALLTTVAIHSRGQETVTFDGPSYDSWDEYVGLFIVAVILWVIIATLGWLVKGRDEVETPRSLVPKD